MTAGERRGPLAQGGGMPFAEWAAARPETELHAARFVMVIVSSAALIIAATWGFTLQPGDAPESYRATLALSLAVPALLGLASPWLPLRSVRLVAAVLAVATVALAAVLLTEAATGVPLADRVLWPLSITAVATTAALIAAGIWVAIGTLAVVTASLQALRIVSGGLDIEWLVNDAQALLSSVVVLVLVGSFLRASRDLDAAVATALDAETERASASGRRAAAQRAQALVHDEVIATLLLASRDSPALRASVAEQAGTVMDRIAALERDLDDAPIQQAELVERITAIASRVAPGASVQPARVGPAPLESAVADALAGAVEQALVNSARHAGEAEQSVRIEGGDGAAAAITVTVCDNGAGFDPSQVPPDRLGLATSIVGRMRAVGGRADVTSAVGRGTTVRLEWRPRRSGADVSATRPQHPRIFRHAHVIVAAFCIVQSAFAGLIALESGAVLAPLITLVGVCTGLLALGWRTLTPPAPGRAAGAAGLACAGAIGATVLGAGIGGFVAAWPLTAAAFVLAAIAMRGRPAVAAGGLVVLAAAGVTVAIGNGFALAETIAAVGRPVIVVAVAVTATAQLGRLWARTEAIRAHHVEALRRAERSRAARAELRTRAAELERLVGPTLDRVRSGDTDADLRRACAALEGQLRDRYRGGRLARPPVIEAASDARRRGVDVVLLDDAGDREFGERDLERIAEWMRERLDDVRHGRFTGRLLPSDSPSLASAVSPDGVWTYGG